MSQMQERDERASVGALSLEGVRVTHDDDAVERRQSEGVERRSIGGTALLELECDVAQPATTARCHPDTPAWSATTVTFDPGCRY